MVLLEHVNMCNVRRRALDFEGLYGVYIGEFGVGPTICRIEPLFLVNNVRVHITLCIRFNIFKIFIYIQFLTEE